MNTLTKYWFLEGFNLFKKLGRINMMRICELLEMDNYNKGSLILLKNEDEKCVFFLKRGSVKIVNTLNNSVKHVVKHGNIFGELALYDHDASKEEEAYALEDSIICYIKFEQMNELMEKHKSLKNAVLKTYGLRIKKLERRLNSLIYKDSPTRIREFIIEFVEEFGQLNEMGHFEAKNLLSHSDIANLTNTSRQTVSNTLSILRKEKKINYNADIISINTDTKRQPT